MKKIWILSVLAIAIVACSSSSSATYTANELIRELTALGLPLASATCNSIKLNGKFPKCFQPHDSHNFLYVYEYRSSKGVKLALAQYEKYKEKYNIVIPQIFVLNNILVMYYTGGPRTDHYTDRNPLILEAIEKLEKRKEAVK